jgi:valyl-tRNA synthetase
MALTVGNTPGTDTKLDENKIKGYKNFANKVWNISRFILENTSSQDLNIQGDDMRLWSEFKTQVQEIGDDIENYRLYLAAEKIYHYIWHTLADDIIESSKLIFNGGLENVTVQDPALWISSRKALLRSILKDVLKLLHPFMPFVTEEIWQSLPETDGMLMVSPWPKA